MIINALGGFHVNAFHITGDWCVRIEIDLDAIPDTGRQRRRLVVMHECSWYSDNNNEFEIFRKLQEEHGSGLKLKATKIYRPGELGETPLQRGTICSYKIEDFAHKVVLVWPATGEEFYFEIYATNHHGALLPIHSSEF